MGCQFIAEHFTHTHTRTDLKAIYSNIFYTIDGEPREKPCWGSYSEAAMLPAVPSYTITSIMHINTLQLQLQLLFHSNPTIQHVGYITYKLR